MSESDSAASQYVNSSKAYRQWVKKIREIAMEPVMSNDAFFELKENGGTTQGFTIQGYTFFDTMRLFQQIAQNMRPIDESYWITIDQIRFIRKCMLEGKTAAITMWRE